MDTATGYGVCALLSYRSRNLDSYLHVPYIGNFKKRRRLDDVRELVYLTLPGIEPLR